MKNASVWVIEDNAADVFLIVRALEAVFLHAAITVIKDGEEALNSLGACAKGNRTAPDLLLLDLHLPKIGGAEILQFVHSSPLLSRICLAVLSSLPLQAVSVTLRPTDHYIEKPPHLHQYISSITDWAKGCAPQNA